MNSEKWKPICGVEHYEVSNYGNVRSNRSGVVLKQATGKDGYKRISIKQNGITKTFLVHRLVGKSFLPNDDNLPEINHKDENKGNNHYENLEWCTARYNSNYGTCKERMTKKKQEQMGKKVLCVETNEVFPSLCECARELGIDASNICKVLKGKAKSANKMHFEYWRD